MVLLSIRLGLILEAQYGNSYARIISTVRHSLAVFKTPEMKITKTFPGTIKIFSKMDNFFDSSVTKFLKNRNK